MSAGKVPGCFSIREHNWRFFAAKDTQLIHVFYEWILTRIFDARYNYRRIIFRRTVQWDILKN